MDVGSGERAAFPGAGAAKDTGLIAAARRESGTPATLIDAVARQFRKAADGGHGGEDMAAVYRAFRPEPAGTRAADHHR